MKNLHVKKTDVAKSVKVSNTTIKFCQKGFSFIQFKTIFYYNVVKKNTFLNKPFSSYAWVAFLHLLLQEHKRIIIKQKHHNQTL